MEGTARDISCCLHVCASVTNTSHQQRTVLLVRPTDVQPTDKLQVHHGPSKFVNVLIIDNQKLKNIQ